MMLSRRGMPRLSQMIAAYGRGGDSMLAHINPQEAAMLKARGGAGTVNPITGIREFYTGGLGGRAAAFGGNAYGGKSGGSTGGGLSSRAASYGDNAYGGVARGGIGAPGATGVGSAAAAALGMGGLGGASMSSGAPSNGIGSENAAIGSTAAPTAGTHVSLGGPLGLVGSLSGVPAGGLLGGLIDSALGLDMGFDIGGESVTEARDRLSGSTRSSGGLGAAGQGAAGGPGRDSIGSRGGKKVTTTPGVPAPVPAPTPTGPPAIPDWLKQIAGDSLSPLQLRSLIATQGSQGMDSAYRDMATLDYYRKLLKSSVQDYGQILPVEHRYLQDVYGFQYQPTLPDFYRSIGG